MADDDDCCNNPLPLMLLEMLCSAAAIAFILIAGTVSPLTTTLVIVAMTVTIVIAPLYGFNKIILTHCASNYVCVVYIGSIMAWPAAALNVAAFIFLIIDLTKEFVPFKLSALCVMIGPLYYTVAGAFSPGFWHPAFKGVCDGCCDCDVEAPQVRQAPSNIASTQEHRPPAQQTATRKTQHEQSVDLLMLMSKRQLKEVWRQQCGALGGRLPSTKVTIADEIADAVSHADIRKNFSMWSATTLSGSDVRTSGSSNTRVAPPTPDISTIASDPTRPPTRPEDSAALRSHSTIASDPAWPPTRPRDPSIDPVLKWIASQSQASTSLGGLAAVSGSAAIPSSLKPLEFVWTDIRIDRMLGLGSFGKVYLAELHHTQVAIKLLVDAKAAAAASMGPGSQLLGTHGGTLPSAPINKLVEEVTIMAALRHPNVALLVGFCIAPPCLAIELCGRGSLYDVLQQASIDPAAAAGLTWERAIRMAADAAAGMHHLHTRSPLILHRDLKSPNLLVAADWTVKISDMGLSKLINEATGNSSATAGGVDNPRWLAPELMRGKGSSKSSDVFSFGVILWELLTWELPWKNTEKWQIVGNLLDGRRLPVPLLSELPYKRTVEQSRGLEASYDAYVGLMQRCWVADVAARPDFSTIAEGLRAML